MIMDPKTDPSGPGSVLVSEECNTEKTKKVMYDQLKAPGDQRKVHRIPREQPVAIGDFIISQMDTVVKEGARVVTYTYDLVSGITIHALVAASCSVGNENRTNTESYKTAKRCESSLLANQSTTDIGCGDPQQAYARRAQKAIAQNGSRSPKWPSLPNLKGDPLHRPIGPIGQGLNTPMKDLRDIYRLFYSNQKTEDQNDDR